MTGVYGFKKNKQGFDSSVAMISVNAKRKYRKESSWKIRLRKKKSEKSG